MKHIPNSPRILVHGDSAGGITKSDIERRARELALIRKGDEDYTDDDLGAAQHELLGGQDIETVADDVESDAEVTRDPSDPPSNPGSLIAPVEPPDENVAPERLALQGVEEAEHEQMVEARRRRNRNT